ncbi:MAG: hypothetical protein LBD12_01390, partial [Clostridiales Family XIII bacterium]|nr:hypothetical protein [Clostridiales Family XIII bacterium]
TFAISMSFSFSARADRRQVPYMGEDMPRSACPFVVVSILTYFRTEQNRVLPVSQGNKAGFMQFRTKFRFTTIRCESFRLPCRIVLCRIVLSGMPLLHSAGRQMPARA